MRTLIFSLVAAVMTTWIVMMGSMSQVQAQPRPLGLAPPLELAEEFNTTEDYDYLLMPLSGLAGASMGAMVGYGIGSGFCSDSRGFLGCSIEEFAGASLGATISSVSGLVTYASARQLRGNFALGAVGYVAGFGVGGLMIFGGAYVPGLVFLAVLPPMLATFGYLAFEGDSEAPKSASLLHVEPGDGMSFGVPAVSVQVKEEDVRVSMPLLGGHF